MGSGDTVELEPYSDDPFNMKDEAVHNAVDRAYFAIRKAEKSIYKILMDLNEKIMELKIERSILKGIVKDLVDAPSDTHFGSVWDTGKESVTDCPLCQSTQGHKDECPYLRALEWRERYEGD